jgi:uncharacterized protein (TIGR03435 family)
VDDASGIAGVFDFKLEWTPDDNRAALASGGAPGAEASDPASFAASLSNALEDQLGLKLEARKIPLEVLVVDHAKKPMEN